MSCEWPVARECLPPLPELPDTPTPEQQAAYDLALAQRNSAEDMAVHVLWALSGRQFGLCEFIVRPCRSEEWPRFLDPWFGAGGPYVLGLDSGHWVNWPCGCVGSCTVAGPRVVHLPGPAHDVVAVSIDGQVLDTDQYRLEGDALYRRGGKTWPRQDLGRPLGEAGTWSVTYRRGYPVPPGVDRLTGQLAMQFVKACTSGKCDLPKTVVSTTQRGVTHVFDPSKILAAGKTGLPEVDMWLAAVNPHHLVAAPQVI